MSKRPFPEHLPFEELTVCPECGAHDLKKTHDQKYAGKEGIYRYVIYNCPKGHRATKRQLVVRQFLPDNEWWIN